MKTRHWVLLAAVAIFGIWTTATYPLIGSLVYDDGGRLEARAYGLREESADIDGLRMAYYIGGPADAKETIVLLHGYSADKQVWPRFARHLIDHYRIVIPDLAGHGDSGFSTDQSYSAPAQARRVALLMDRLGIQQIHIAGNSMGGFVAAHFALANPQRTSSLGLLDAAGLKSPQPSELDRMLAIGHNPFIVHTREEFDSFYEMTMAQPPLLPGFVLAAIAQRYESHQSQLEKIFEDFHERDLLDDKLSSIAAPTLVIWGSNDRLIDVSAAKAWSSGLPHSRDVVMTGIGHMPMLEDPAGTAKTYRDFVASLSATNDSALSR